MNLEKAAKEEGSLKNGLACAGGVLAEHFGNTDKAARLVKTVK